MKPKIATKIGHSRIICINPNSKNTNHVGQVAEYESMLDLFTLISFVLICAAFLFIKTNQMGVKQASDVTATLAKENSNATVLLPSNLLLFTLYSDNGVNRMSIINEESNISINKAVTASNINKLLEGVEVALNKADSIQFAVADTMDVSPSIIVKMQHWLANHNCKYKFYFYH